MKLTENERTGWCSSAAKWIRKKSADSWMDVWESRIVKRHLGARRDEHDKTTGSKT